MRCIWAVLLVLTSTVGLWAQDSVQWIHDWKEGLSQAKASGKPIFVMFTADW
jgi:hypothetical protein